MHNINVYLFFYIFFKCVLLKCLADEGWKLRSSCSVLYSQTRHDGRGLQFCFIIVLGWMRVLEIFRPQTLLNCFLSFDGVSAFVSFPQIESFPGLPSEVASSHFFSETIGDEK